MTTIMINGPAGSGKKIIAETLSKSLNYTIIDINDCFLRLAQLAVEKNCKSNNVFILKALISNVKPISMDKSKLFDFDFLENAKQICQHKPLIDEMYKRVRLSIEDNKHVLKNFIIIAPISMNAHMPFPRIEIAVFADPQTCKKRKDKDFDLSFDDELFFKPSDIDYNPDFTLDTSKLTPAQACNITHDFLVQTLRKAS